ncbi:hypothetical protein PV05_06158 [Exophiala xenobiotica]|uniref:Major facilitator superfamily (MFS) profile domain-containing protein n=1 Tax=Exophiala xenobiotica TaxID=348802 RepID=A0A0D2F193_9EURO|nr:uncharacterized protein PV05_06158 [Exophiala xenobiotica]KIW53744.1 hypothetical protein PV05_06158 [Exophiala xenobiotica]
MASSSRNPLTRLHGVFKKMTWTLFTAWMITSLLNVMFGYDTTSFAGVQSIPSFDKQFGTPSKGGTYALSPSRASFMSSCAFAGKLLGALSAPLPVEWFGHRYILWLGCCIAFLGIIIEATSSTVAQFVVGRNIIYFSVGMVEVTVPMYQAELCPAAMRGTIVGSMQLFNQVGQITAAGVNRAFYQSTKRSGWLVPVCVQLICPFVVVFGLFIVPDAPRWLLSKSRFEDAVKSLERVRPGEDVRAGLCRKEAEAIREALDNKVEKGPWIDLVRGTNLRRTTIVLTLLLLQQFCGQGFVSQYSPRFYKKVGLGAHAFDYNIASATAGWAGCLLGMIASDIVGRRDLLIWGCITFSLFLFLVSGLGLHAHPSPSEARGLVASVVLYIFIFTGLVALPYRFGATHADKTVQNSGSNFVCYCFRSSDCGLEREDGWSRNCYQASLIHVVGAFIVAFCVPYLINAISANIGWLFGGIALFTATWVFFFVPETKNRSLEEMDELFSARIPARKFKHTETVGAAHRVTELENAGLSDVVTEPGKVQEWHDEQLSAKAG